MCVYVCVYGGVRVSLCVCVCVCVDLTSLTEMWYHNESNYSKHPIIRTAMFEIISTHENLGMRLDPPLVLDPLIHVALRL